MVFQPGGEAANFFLIAIASIQLNINFETSYVSLAQVVAVKF